MPPLKRLQDTPSRKVEFSEDRHPGDRVGSLAPTDSR